VGDPTVLGWGTVGAYTVAALLVWRAWRTSVRERRAGHGASATRFWAVVLGGTVVLGANKQLDLQSRLVAWFWSLPAAQAWQDHRGTVQIGFVLVLFLLGAALCAWLGYLARRELRRVFLALVGWTLLCTYVAIRALATQHVDRLFGVRAVDAHLRAVLELGAVALLAIGAIVYVRRRE
jgi:hypothetical protein